MTITLVLLNCASFHIPNNSEKTGDYLLRYALRANYLCQIGSFWTNHTVDSCFVLYRSKIRHLCRRYTQLLAQASFVKFCGIYREQIFFTAQYLIDARHTNAQEYPNLMISHMDHLAISVPAYHVF